MNLEELKEHIAQEEGLKYEIYRCSEGYPTAGIGHLITEWDEDYFDKPIGTEVSKEQVDAWFEKDLNVAIGDMEKFTEGMNVDENVKECVTHMVFQLGLPRLNKFKKAEEHFNSIKLDYPKSPEAKNIDAFISKAIASNQ